MEYFLKLVKSGIDLITVSIDGWVKIITKSDTH